MSSSSRTFQIAAVVLLLLGLSFQPIESFSVAPRWSRLSFSTKHSFRLSSSVPSQHDTATTTAAPSTDQDSQPAWINLPTRLTVQDRNRQELFKVAELTEISLGRAAMIAAIVLLGQELVTGKSFSEQLVDLTSRLWMH